MTEFTLHIGDLIARHFREELSASEAQELEQYLASDPGARQMFEEVNNGEYVSKSLQLWNRRDYSRLTSKIAEEVPAFGETHEPDFNHGMASVHGNHFLPLRRVIKTPWFRWAAAIIILFGIGTYIFTHTSPAKELAQTTPSAKPNDILPGSNRAVLTLSDGKKVELDSAASETITDGNLLIENNAGQLVYISERGSLSPAGGSPREAGEGGPATYNTMSTPRGGQYQLTLSDGTKVWLNAASSITFPTAFKGKSREVSITGEAYFEVGKNKEKPFVVSTKKDRITVLGTTFNVQAYPDEMEMKTTLLEGLVQINGDILKPRQSYVNGKIVRTDVDQDIAWKNGVFNFNKLRVEEAMRQIARWYDVEIIYDQGVPEKMFVGKMKRKLPLKDMLSGLEGIVASFRLEGKKLYVRPLKSK